MMNSMIKKITKNKTFVAYFSKSSRFKTIISFDVSWTVKCDHAGFRVYCQLYKFSFELELTDNRHWDLFNNRFEENVQNL